MARSLSTGQASCQFAHKYFNKVLWSTSTVLTVQCCSILHAAAHKGISRCLHRFQQKAYVLQTPPSAAVLAHSTCNSNIVTPCAPEPSLLLVCQACQVTSQCLLTQVASFTSTAVAAERALGAKLPIASSQKQAEQLLQETAEAQQADLSLKGIHDLRGLLEAASRNRVLHPVHLDGVAASLEASCLSGCFWNVHNPLLRNPNIPIICNSWAF